MVRGIVASAAIAVFLVAALAIAGRAQTRTSGTAQDSSSAQGAPSKAAKKVGDAHTFGVMSEAAGCTVLNKGKHGQICYYDVTRLRPERTRQRGADVPIYVSVRNHDTILWHSGGATPFHVIGITLRPGQNSPCPHQAFENDFKDNDAEPWSDAVSSGLPNPLAGHYQCEYKTHVKWKDGKLGDPHIIIGDDSPPNP